jgi:hypothetical protein
MATRALAAMSAVAVLRQLLSTGVALAEQATGAGAC